MVSKLQDRLNFHKQFKKWYDLIRKDFKFDYQKDCEARDYLSRIFLKKSRDWKLNDVLNLHLCQYNTLIKLMNWENKEKEKAYKRSSRR